MTSRRDALRQANMSAQHISEPDLVDEVIEQNTISRPEIENKFEINIKKKTVIKTPKSINFEAEVYASLKKRAAELGTSVSDLVNELAKAYLRG